MVRNMEGLEVERPGIGLRTRDMGERGSWHYELPPSSSFVLRDPAEILGVVWIPVEARRQVRSCSHGRSTTPTRRRRATVRTTARSTRRPTQVVRRVVRGDAGITRALPPPGEYATGTRKFWTRRASLHGGTNTPGSDGGTCGGTIIVRPWRLASAVFTSLLERRIISRCGG